MKKLTALIILDGFGYTKRVEGNAIIAAGIPNIRRLAEQYPHTLLEASGLSVGLPEGQMGNSEVGHLNIGAGRIVYQELTRIDKSIEDGEFYKNPAFLAAIDNCKKNASALHLMGLCSPGGVHSHTNHLYALLRLAHSEGLSRVFVHCFTDGRDTPPTSGIEYIRELEANIREIGCGKIATVTGRFYAMDRDKRYNRVQRAYDAIVMGLGERFPSAEEALLRSYERNVTDEFVEPAIIEEGATISENDSVIFFNFRPDRAREITRTLILDETEFDIPDFERGKGYFPVCFVAMAPYEESLNHKFKIAFDHEHYKNVLGEYLSRKDMTQLRIAETEKYAHVTFFFNGGVETLYKREDRALIPSPKVNNYDECPEMSAYKVTDELIKRISSGAYDFIVLNYANPDMVGHTGNFEATVEAVKTVDECVQRVVDCILAMGGRCIITADHGNCEEMVDPRTNGVSTYHTTALVPFILVDNENRDVRLRKGGRLCDIAPTILKLMGLRKPTEMTGRSLITSVRKYPKHERTDYPIK